MPFKYESLLAGTARHSRAHKWYSALTGYASVNDLYINKESTTAWFWIWSLDWIHCRLWHWWLLIDNVHNGGIGRILNENLFLSSEFLSSTAHYVVFLLVPKCSRWEDRNRVKSKSNDLKNLSVYLLYS